MGNDNCLACTHELHTPNYRHTCEKGTATAEGTSTASSYTFDNYQKATARTAFYPGAGTGSTEAINYAILGLIGEAGEIANKWKKIFRDKDGVADLEDYDFLLDEAGDVEYYLSRLITELNSNHGSIAAANIRKLADRKNRGKLGGSGDNR